MKLDRNFLELLGVPKELYDLLEFIDARFGRTDGKAIPIKLTVEAFKKWCDEGGGGLDKWTLVLPSRRYPDRRVEIPLPVEIDKDDPEGHWRAILAAAADFQALVETGQYDPGFDIVE